METTKITIKRAAKAVIELSTLLALALLWTGRPAGIRKPGSRNFWAKLGEH